MDGLDRLNEENLLLNSKNEHVDENAIGMYIQHYTMKGIGEGRMFKIKINLFKGDLNKLKEFEEDRGSQISSIFTYYNIQGKYIEMESHYI